MNIHDYLDYFTRDYICDYTSHRHPIRRWRYLVSEQNPKDASRTTSTYLSNNIINPISKN
jgi:hypothetical protein